MVGPTYITYSIQLLFTYDINLISLLISLIIPFKYWMLGIKICSDL